MKEKNICKLKKGVLIVQFLWTQKLHWGISSKKRFIGGESMEIIIMNETKNTTENRNTIGKMPRLSSHSQSVA